MLEEEVEEDGRRHEEAQEHQPDLPHCTTEQVDRARPVYRDTATQTDRHIPFHSGGTSSFVISAPHLCEVEITTLQYQKTVWHVSYHQCKEEDRAKPDMLSLSSCGWMDGWMWSCG